MVLHLQDFMRRFSSNDHCLDFLFALRFIDAECPKCSRKGAYHKHSKKLCYTCNCGRSHIYPMKGTIFQGSPVALTKWFKAVLLVAQSPHGISAKEIERQLGVTYPTAWRMAKRIRAAEPNVPDATDPLYFDSYLLSCAGCKDETANCNV